MGRLLLVEIRRALARGVTRTLVLLGVVAVLAVGLLVFFVNQDAAGRRVEARTRYEEQVASCQDQSSGMGKPPGMARPPGLAAPSPAEQQAMCERYSSYLLESAERGVFRLTELWPELPTGRRFVAEVIDLLNAWVMLPAALLMLGAVVAGASMAGAEWQAGSLVTLLTWEPRRGRLLTARMLAAALIGGVIAVALLALFTAVLVPTAVVKGEMPATADWWVTYAGVVLRLGALTGLAAAVGVALAMIGRRTALAVIALFVYLIGGEVIARIFWEPSRSWLVVHNIALVLGGEELVPTGGSAASGLAVVTAWSAVVIGLAVVLFRRRDFASTG